MARTKPKRQTDQPRKDKPVPVAVEAPPAPQEIPPVVFLVIAAWLALTLIVCASVRLPGVVPHGNETTWDRAVFTATSAATLTGFQQTMGVSEMAAASWAGPLLLLALTLAGTFTSLFVGGLAASRILRTGHTALQIAASAVTAQAIATIVGATALVGSAGDPLVALFQSASAFGNSGLWLGPPPTTTGATTHAILLPLAVLGGLGLPVLMDLTNWMFGKSDLSTHTRTVLKLSALAYLLGFLVLVVAQFPAASSGGWPAWRATFASCTTAAINTRTAGLPLQSPAAFTGAGQWVLMALMAIGAAPAGTAGGLKLTTLFHLTGGTRQLLRTGITKRITAIAIVWAGIYAITLFIGMALLAACDSVTTGDRVLFLAVSALSNVGLSHDPVSMTGPALIVLSGLMLIGRIMPLAVLWWVARTGEPVDVLIG
jgi:Trk-type K+ transport system membrane component